jgi:peptidoglycan/LPS O-acetylase OafA/YrhL
MSETVKYRPDIDGLRAVAVLPVVFFHADIKGFTGGFVGVDIFFVISGYLITTVIYTEMVADRFSILSFYERRIRRLLPALLVVIFASAIAASFLLLPDELIAFGKSVISTILFVSNALFWTESGYFDSAAGMKPLLHTWSLAVEEQFYIVYPLALLLCFKFSPRIIPVAVAGAALGSFLLALFLQPRWPDANFYLPFPRGWELLIGALLAMDVFPEAREERLRTGLGALGLTLIAWSVFAYDDDTSFPGASAMLPTAGAALIIYAGRAGPSLITRALGRQEIVFIGLISYSLYLWHWPVLVFARLFALRALTPFESGMAIVVSFLLAMLSWRYVERPFRLRTTLPYRPTLFGTAAGAMASFVLLGAILIAYDGLPQRVPENARKILSAAADKEIAEERYQCAVFPLLPSREFGPCPIGATEAVSPTVVVWGDSSANALQPMFDAILEDKGLSGFLASTPGCPPLLGIDRIGYSIECEKTAEKLFGFLQSRNVRKVIVVGAWGNVFYKDKTVFHGKVGNDNATRLANVRAAMRLTFERFEKAGMEIAFMLPVPGGKKTVPQTLARSIILDRPTDIEYSREEYHRRIDELLHLLDEQPGGIGAVVKVEDFFCEKKCAVSGDGHSFYYDNYHPSLYLNRVLRPAIEGQLHDFLITPTHGQDSGMTRNRDPLHR